MAMIDDPKQDGSAQSQRFIDMAREINADTDLAAFDLVLNEVSKPTGETRKQPTVTKVE